MSDHVCGVYRAKVLARLNSGNLRVQVPTLLGMTPIIARPCRDPEAFVSDHTHDTDGGGETHADHPHDTLYPEVGDAVWVAFEAGDIEHPVWLGVWGW